MHGNSHVRFGERDEETHLLADGALHPYSTILGAGQFPLLMAPSVCGLADAITAQAKAKRPPLASGPLAG
mgnify:CR=1 FL=1